MILLNRSNKPHMICMVVFHHVHVIKTDQAFNIGPFRHQGVHLGNELFSFLIILFR